MKRSTLVATLLVPIVGAFFLLAPKAQAILDANAIFQSALIGIGLAFIWFAWTRAFTPVLDPLAFSFLFSKPPYRTLKALARASAAFVLLGALLGILVFGLSAAVAQRFATEPWNAVARVETHYRMKGLFAGMCQFTVTDLDTGDSFRFAWSMKGEPLSRSVNVGTVIALRGRGQSISKIVDEVQIVDQSNTGAKKEVSQPYVAYGCH